MDLKDVFANIKKFLGSEEIETTVDIATNTMEAYKPETTFYIETIKKIAESADKVKLKYILRGLAGQNNVEMRINQLYSYVNSPKRAFLVSNLFREALLSQSPIVCCILGIALGENLNNNKECSYEDSIILNALQTATDFEIKYLREIYESYTLDGYIDIKKIERSSLADQYMLTVDWGENQ